MTVATASGERVTVLLLTYGEPARARFADQFTYSLLILRRLTKIVAPIPTPVMPLIALMRGRTRVKTWREEEYASPLETITEEQAEGIRAQLEKSAPETDWDVRVIYEFRRPLLNDQLRDLLKNPPDRLLLVPLYLADSDFTSGVSKRDLDRFSDQYGEIKPEPEYVSEFTEDPELIELMERFVLEQCEEQGWDTERRKKAALLLGAHGTLVDGPPGIDTGLGPTQCYYQRLRDRLSPNFAYTSVGWLNHTMGGEWTSPALETAAEETVNEGITDVVYFPFGFLADNAESELEGRQILREHDSLNVLHLPCVNTWSPLIEHLANRIHRQVTERTAQKTPA